MRSDRENKKLNKRVMKVNQRKDDDDNLRDINEEDSKAEQAKDSAKDFFSNFKYHKSPAQKRKKESKVKPKHILIIFVVICLALIISSSFFATSTFRPFQAVASAIIVPAQKGINKIGLWFSDQIELVKSVEELTDENKELKEEINELKKNNSTLRNQSAELTRIQGLLELTELYEDYDFVAANVISKESTKWFSTFTIDKGEKDGIKVDMNVLSGDGLCGIVTSVGYNYATVRAIIDDDSAVSAQFQDSGELCTVDGSLTVQEDNLLQFEDVSYDVEIKKDSAVVTSRISSKFLPGLLIGYVADSKTDSNGLTKSGHLTPACDFTNINEVLVITTLKEDYIKDHPEEYEKETTTSEEETTKASSKKEKETETKYEVVDEPEIETDPETEFVETTVEYDEEGNVIEY